MRICIQNLRVHAFLGLHSWEQQRRKEILVSVACVVNQPPKETQPAVCYSQLAQQITHLIESQRFLLVEQLVESLLAELLKINPIQKAWVEVKKSALPSADWVIVSDESKKADRG